MSKIKGVASTRRLLKRLPGAVNDELADVLTKSGPAVARVITQRVASTTRSRTGRLLAGVKWRVYPRSLRLRAGFLGTPRGRAKLFYARILDLGRRAQTIRVHRRRVAGSALVHGRRVSHPSYLLRVRRIAPKKFITGGIGELRGIIGRQLRNVWERSLKRVAAGSD